MTHKNDTLALLNSVYTLAFGVLCLVLIATSAGWWVLLSLPATAALLFGLIGVTTYRMGDN